MNLGGEFLSRVLLILAVFFGPPLVLAITAGLLARWRQSAAAVCGHSLRSCLPAR